MIQRICDVCGAPIDVDKYGGAVNAVHGLLLTFRGLKSVEAQLHTECWDIAFPYNPLPKPLPIVKSKLRQLIEEWI